MCSNMEGNAQLLPRLLAAAKPILMQRGGTSHAYKRTFPFSNGELVVTPSADVEEQLLQQHANEYAGIKLLRAVWQERLLGGLVDNSGTHFPVAASHDGAVWCSAGHCLQAPKQVGWRCGYGQAVKKAVTQAVEREVASLDWLTSPLQPEDLEEVVPSDPSMPLPPADVSPDFGFLRTFRPELQPEMIFVPSSEPPVVGQAVSVLGFASRPESTWAETFMLRPSDYDLQNKAYTRKHHGRPLPVAECKLDSLEALSRAVELQDDAWHPTDLAVSPGQVTAHNGRIVEHTCTTFPGMSGSAGVDLHTPWKLLFIHMRADADPRRNVNYGVSVHHPLFVQAYVREVLPHLSATPPALFQQGMLPCLHAYLGAHKALLQAQGMWSEAEKFMQAQYPR